MFRDKQTVYKIYHDAPETWKSNKLKELSELRNISNVICPINFLTDSQNNFIGYTMKYVNDSSSLVLYFTNTFKNRHNIGLSEISKIYEIMEITVKEIHKKNILIVDFNELNVLISNSDLTPFFIDTDSFQTIKYPTTAIMPSIRDYTTNKWTELTDFYSFAILMFQLYTGIHPYKGRYIQNEEMSMEDRCKHHISVFNTKVSYPKFVNLDALPSDLKTYFYDVFEKGLRKAPPNVAGIIAGTNVTQRIVSQSTFIETIIHTFKETIKGIFQTQFGNIYIFNNHCYFKGQEYTNHFPIEVPYVFNSRGFPRFSHVTKATDGIAIFSKILYTVTIPNILKSSIIGNYIACLVEEKVLFIQYQELLDKFMVDKEMSVLSESTEFFSNIIYTNVFGKAQVIVSHDTSLMKVRIEELDDHKIMDMSLSNFIIQSISAHKGKYYRSIFVLNEFFQITQKRVDEVDMQELHYVSLINGNFINLIGDDIEIFNKMDISKTKLLKDATIQHKIVSDQNDVLMIKDNQLVKLTMK